MTIKFNIIKKVQTVSGAHASAGGSGGVTVAVIVASALGVSIFCVMAIIIIISAVLCLIKEGTCTNNYDTFPVH